MKATKDPRGALVWFYGFAALLNLLFLGVDLTVAQPVFAAFDAALAVLLFFLWRTERAQRKLDRELVQRNREAMEFARHQPDDITHGEARQQMIEFIREQQKERERA